MSNVVSFPHGDPVNYATVPKQQSGVANCIELINQRKNQVHNIILVWTEINGEGVKICNSTMTDYEFRGMVAVVDDFIAQRFDIETWEGLDDGEDE